MYLFLCTLMSGYLISASDAMLSLKRIALTTEIQMLESVAQEFQLLITQQIPMDIKIGEPTCLKSLNYRNEIITIIQQKKQELNQLEEQQ